MSKKLQKNTPIGQYASVDWFTGTSSAAKSRNLLAELAHTVTVDRIELGYKHLPWAWYGYEGWSVEGLRFGRREQDDIIQLSGEVADAWWLPFAELVSNCSRLDLAVTVKYQWDDIGLANRLYRDVGRLAEDLPIARSYALITSLLGGDTLYLGKRASTQFGRIYDKARESGEAEFAHCWRYEVEFKKPLAWGALAALVKADDKRAYISGQVHQWFTDRLIAVDWQPASEQGAIAIQRRKTSDEKALDWLGKSVAPTVARLVKRGKLKSTLNALGISMVQLKEADN